MKAMFQTLVAIAMLAFGLANAGPIPDKEYKTINPALPTATGDKLEVLEFFQYSCGHCYEFEPTMKAWKSKKAKDVELQYVPTVWDESRVPQAKIYYTLEAMGLLDQLHDKVYDAIHNKQVKLFMPDKELLMKWVAQQPGVDTKKFSETYDSFGVNSKVQRAQQMTKQYRISGTPTVVVNGKYVTGPSFTMGGNGAPDYMRFTQVLEDLLSMERTSKKAAK